MSEKGTFCMRWLLFIFFFLAQNNYLLQAMPGADSSSADESDDSSGDDSGGDDGDTQQVKPAGMPTSSQGSSKQVGSGQEEPIIESTRLEGPDIILLENEKDIVKIDNDKIVGLSSDAEAKLGDLD